MPRKAHPKRGRRVSKRGDGQCHRKQTAWMSRREAVRPGKGEKVG